MSLMDKKVIVTGGGSRGLGLGVERKIELRVGVS